MPCGACVFATFASWRAGAGAARTGPNVRRRGGEATHRPERAARARAGRQLRRCRRRAGRWFRRRDLAARSFASWGRGGTAGGFAVSVPVTSPLGGPVPRPGGRASARPSGYASRYGAGVHAAGLFVSLSVGRDQDRPARGRAARVPPLLSGPLGSRYTVATPPETWGGSVRRRAALSRRQFELPHRVF